MQFQIMISKLLDKTVVKIGENKDPKIPWHFKPTQLGERERERERESQYSVTLGKCRNHIYIAHTHCISNL
jgi:hypothetical protein